MLIQGAEGIFTGLPGAAMRAKGAIRIADGRITEIGALTPRPDEAVIDASGCVIYPGLISTHHHLFQSILKGVRSGIDSPLHAWLRAVAYSFWHKIDEEALRVAARIGLAELLLSGTTTAADHHYLFAESYRFDPAHVIFEVAHELGLRLVFSRGGATKARTFDFPGLVPTPIEPLERMIKSVEACAQRYHDPSPGSLRRVVLAPTNPPYSVEPGELKEIAAAARHMGCASTAICRNARPTSSIAWPPSASVRSRGWPSTIGSAPTSGSRISFTSTIRRSSSWSRPVPAWRTARNRIAGSAPASRRRSAWRRSAARSRSRSTAPHRTKPPT
jgi:hypothetical protein